MGNPARKIRRPVNRVHHPGAVAHLAAIFLAQKRVAGEGRKQPTAHQLLHLAIGRGQVILRPFELENHRIAVKKTPLLQSTGVPRHSTGDKQPVIQEI